MPAGSKSEGQSQALPHVLGSCEERQLSKAEEEKRRDRGKSFLTQSVFVPSQTLPQLEGGTASANDARQLAPFIRRAVFIPRSD